MLIYNAIQNSINNRSHHFAIFYRDKKISYSELGLCVNKMIDALLMCGVKQRDRIAVLAENSPEIIYFYIAASYLGITIVFLYDLFDATSFEFQQLIDSNQPDWILMDETHRETIKQISFKKERIISFNEFTEAQIPSINISSYKRNCDSLFIQAYTSGTTGAAKGVCLSEQALFKQAKNIAFTMQIETASKVLLTGFLFNTTGLPLSLAVLLQGGTLVFKTFQDVKNIFAEVEQKNITHFMLQPYGIARALSDEQLQKRHLKCLKLIAYGAAPMPRDLLQKARELIKCEWLQGYGLTETCGPITWLTEGDHLYKMGSVGKSNQETQICIIAEDHSILEPFEHGEVVIKGPSVMLGYWNPVYKKADALLSDWFYTGDIGYMDSDGYLYLMGRKKEAIVTANGFTLYPKEIENVIQQYKDIEEVVVIGWKDEKDESEYPVAFIKSRSNLDVCELKKFLSLQLSSLKLPRYIIPEKDSFPRNRNGKIQKYILQEKLNIFLKKLNLSTFSGNYANV